jgi:hypothetical protein
MYKWLLKIFKTLASTIKTLLYPIGVLLSSFYDIHKFIYFNMIKYTINAIYETIKFTRTVLDQYIITKVNKLSINLYKIKENIHTGYLTRKEYVNNVINYFILNPVFLELFTIQFIFLVLTLALIIGLTCFLNDTMENHVINGQIVLSIKQIIFTRIIPAVLTIILYYYFVNNNNLGTSLKVFELITVRIFTIFTLIYILFLQQVKP